MQSFQAEFLMLARRTKRDRVLTTIMVIAGWSMVPVFLSAQEPTDLEVMFVHQVLPVLQEKCIACHGGKPEDIQGDLDLRSRQGLVAGGESEGPAWNASDPLESPLLKAVRWDGLEMPPKQNDRLTEMEVAAIQAWLVGGAPWPSPSRIAEIRLESPTSNLESSGVTVRTSGGLSETWTLRRYPREHLWAYRPLAIATAEPGDREEGNLVDHWVGVQLKQKGVEQAAEADRRTLIRRATFDLIGLPPTREQIRAFVNDPEPTPQAFSSLVDHLLESPHYGEHWGRHWLDVVRYADSSGFANDYERGNAWRYRDYVVRCFNEDRPYDQFIREQIAGDEIDPEDPEMLVAVGFLRMGPWELTGMEVARVARQKFLDDVTDSVGQVFLAHMLQCARCHDHKFDPIPTRDYYSMQAIFASTQLVERAAPFLPDENTDGFEERKYLEERAAHYQSVLREVEGKHTLEAARAWYQSQGLAPEKFERVVQQLRGDQDEKKVSFFQVRDEMARQGIDPALIPPRHVGFEPVDFGKERVARKGLTRLQWQRERYEPYALSVYNGMTPRWGSVHAPIRMPGQAALSGKIDATYILDGGDPFVRLQEVLPGTLSVINLMGVNNAASEPLPTSAEGRRTALAHWIASPENPLTARVMVNRIWQWHFGRPLAGNPNNFGATGKLPSHPELLDELAAYFIRHEWSIKAMHRLLMNTRTYRQSGRHPEGERLQQLDAEQTLYATFYPRRLEAEEIRDAMLMVSGELNVEVGGVPVRPNINPEVALQPRQVMGSFAEAWQPSTKPETRNRRSIYALKIRGLRDPFMEVLNVPASDASCEAREQTTVTPQVFAMFNSEISYDRALALAHDVLTRQHEQELAIQEVFNRVLGRSADSEEIQWSIDHWVEMTRTHEGLQFESKRPPIEVQRQAVEENTGEKFTFSEPLEFNRDYVPDLQPGDVDATTRGFAELCLVLLNSNEFVYLD